MPSEDNERMTKDEREALMRANAESRERLLDDMARRRRQRLEEPFDDDDDPLPQRTSPVVLNRGEHQVREHHERGRPVLDDATMQLWNAWLDQRCAAMIDARLEMLADVLGQESGDIEYRLRRDIKGFRASVTRKITEELVR